MEQEEKQYIDQLTAEMEKKIRFLPTETEVEFKNAGKTIGIQIWRIEKGIVKAWPQNYYGTFFQGDSYIILNTVSLSEYYGHLWIGKDSTPDEMGIASFKILQLDEILQKNCTIIYEAQGNESQLFQSYFPVLTILQGGIDPDYYSNTFKKYKPRLFHVKGIGKNVQSREIPISKKNIDSGDVFVLDIGIKLFNWRGKTSSSFEKYQGSYICELIKKQRNGKVEIVSIDEGDNSDINLENIKSFDEFFEKNKNNPLAHTFLRRTVTIIEKLENRVMMKLSDEGGSLKFTSVGYNKNNLNSNDAFLIDRGEEIVIWIGKKASRNEKRYAFAYGKQYLVKNKKNQNVPILTVHEGKLQEEIDKCFN